MEKLRKYIICLAIILSLSTFYLSLKTVFAEPDCNNPATGDIDYCIAKIETEINALKPAHEYNKKELTDLRVQVASLEKRIAGILKQLKVTENDIDKRTLDLAYAEEVFKEKTLNHYKFLRIYDPILPFLSAGDAADAFREIAFRAKAATSDINTMEGYAADLVKLKNDKENLEKNKISLSSSKAKVSERASFLAKEVDKTETYLDKLSSRQEELLAQKAGGFETSVGDTPSTAEPCSGAAGSANFCDPGFRPAYGAFSFGAPHRTGMSQYGALGRSKSGQNAETILSAYYQGSELRKDYPTPPITEAPPSEFLSDMATSRRNSEDARDCLEGGIRAKVCRRSAFAGFATLYISR